MFYQSVSKNNLLNFKRLINDYKTLGSAKRIVIWGAGCHGGIFSEALEREGLTDFVFCDRNESLHKKTINGHRIISPEMVFPQNDFVFLAMEKYKTCAGYLEEKDFEYSVVNNVEEEVFLSKLLGICEKTDLFFGDCMLTSIDVSNNDKYTLAELIEQFGGKTVCGLNNTHAAWFYRIIDFFDRTEVIQHIKSITLMLSVDTFNLKYPLEERNQHEELIANIKNGLDLEDIIDDSSYRVDKNTERISNSTGFGRYDGESEDKKLLTKMNYSRIACIYDIGQNLSDNESLNAIDFIAELCKKNHIGFNVLLLPDNEELLKNLFNDVYYERHDQIVATIRNRVCEVGGKFLDCSSLLRGEDIICKTFTCEGYSANGKRILIKKMQSDGVL